MAEEVQISSISIGIDPNAPQVRATPLDVADALEWRLSGGALNSDQSASLGGDMSSVEVVGAVDGNLFANVPTSEAASGSTKYRCIYIHNATGEAITNFGLYISTPTPSTFTEVYIGEGGLNGSETAVADEDTAPTGVTFTRPTSAAGALSLPDLPAGQHIAIWVRRDVEALAEGAWSDYVRLTPVGDVG
jgi:hypothetical protein